MKILKSKKIFTLGLYLSLFSLVVVLPACWPLKKVTQPKSCIKKVYNLDALKKEIKNLDENSLVIFDVDQTLFVAEGHLDNWTNKKAQAIWRPFLDKLNRYLRVTGDKKLWPRMRFTSKRVLFDNDIVSIIERIKNKKAKVIALTKAVTGELGAFKRFEVVRFKNLKKVGIDFSSTFKKYPDMELTELSYFKKDPAAKIFKDFLTHPVFYNGVLLTARYQKGEVLKTFLDRINWWPKKIIFIDDRIKYLKDVERVAREKGVDFLGFEYHAAVIAPVKIDPKVAAFQIYYLIENKKWVSQEEAKTLMKDNVITWESIVKKYKISKEKVAIKLDPKVYDAYIGMYKTDTGLSISIIKKEDRLFARAMGKGNVEIFPESKTQFFVKDLDAKISFVKDKSGNVTQLMWQQDGQQIAAKKIK